jgi:dTDP-4-dehydrorhamnose reductase
MNAISGTSSKPAAAPVLVVGADGLIGGALWRRARAEGRPVIGTTRRAAVNEVEDDGRIHLDLSDDPAAWALPQSIGAAFLCAGMTGIDACESRPDEARHINVRQTLCLAERLLHRGAHVVFVSTNQVFDGARPHTPPDAPYAPQTTYGRMKVEAERQLSALGGATTILRLSKVAQTLSRLLASWATTLRSGRPVEPFADMRAAPLPLNFVVEMLVRIADGRIIGVVQASGDEDVPYADIARRLAATLGTSESLVRPRPAGRGKVAPRHFPRHTTLDTSRLIRELDLTPPPVWAEIGEVLADVALLSPTEQAHV